MTHRAHTITDAVAARRALYRRAIVRGVDHAIVLQLRAELDAEIRCAKLPVKATNVVKAQPRPAGLRRRRA